MAVISKSRKILYGAVLVGSAVLLVTQVLGRSKSRSSPSTNAEVPAEGVPADQGSEAAAPAPLATAALSLSISGDGTNAPPADVTGAVAGATSVGTQLDAGAGQVDAVLAKLEQALGGMRNFIPERAHPALDGLTHSAPQPEPSTPTTSTPAPQIELPQPEITTRDSSRLELRDVRDETPPPPPPMEQLFQLLATQPLCGIIHGERESQALFGGRIVRLGDQLVPGDAVVKAIDPQAVLVRFKDTDVRIEMPPFHPRPKKTESADGESEVDDKPSEAAQDALGAKTGATDAASQGTTNSTGASSGGSTAGTESKETTNAQKDQ